MWAIKRILLFSLLLVVLSAMQSSASVLGQIRFQDATGTLDNPATHVLAVWNTITVDAVSVHSRRGARIIQDCTKLGISQLEVECFSIQQNF